MACDMCGKKGASLQNVRDCYATDDIQQICDDCVVDVNVHLDKLRGIGRTFTQRMLQKFMKNKASSVIDDKEGDK